MKTPHRVLVMAAATAAAVLTALPVGPAPAASLPGRQDTGEGGRGLTCRTPVAPHEPPCNPHLALSGWGGSHRASYASGSSPFPAPHADDEVVLDRVTLPGSPSSFLDRFAAGDGLRGLAVPLMLGGSPAHALAPELTLRPVLTELGATVPGRALYVVDSRHDDPASYDGWLAAHRPLVRSLLDHRLEAVR